MIHWPGRFSALRPGASRGSGKTQLNQAVAKAPGFGAKNGAILAGQRDSGTSFATYRGEVNVMELEKMETEILREQQLYREVVAILMGSEFYFDLTLDERYRLVKHILANSCLSVPEGRSPRSSRRELNH
jgi:hypothetical protein